jgi:hypothetical protein
VCFNLLPVSPLRKTVEATSLNHEGLLQEYFPIFLSVEVRSHHCDHL